MLYPFAPSKGSARCLGHGHGFDCRGSELALLCPPLATALRQRPGARVLQAPAKPLASLVKVAFGSIDWISAWFGVSVSMSLRYFLLWTTPVFQHHALLSCAHNCCTPDYRVGFGSIVSIFAWFGISVSVLLRCFRRLDRECCRKSTCARFGFDRFDFVSVSTCFLLFSRGNHLFNTTCLIQVFFKSGQYCGRSWWSLTRRSKNTTNDASLDK